VHALCERQHKPPRLLLTDHYGNRVLDKNYANNYVMDPGDSAYDQACLVHATALATKYGFDRP
jgi:hypothetical protein